MISIDDIYVKFRKAQSVYSNRPYKIPKDISAFLEKRLTEVNLKNMQKLADALNTNYRNVDVDRYLEYGFELFGKNFSYIKFLDQRLINFYIMKDKNFKRDMELTITNIDKSIAFVKDFMSVGAASVYLRYGQLRDGYESVAIQHFIKGKIDRYFITWLIFKNYLVLLDGDRELIPLITEQYRNYIYELKKMELLEDIDRRK